MNLQHYLQSTGDVLEEVIGTLKLIADSELIRDLESTEGFQNLTDLRMSQLVRDLNAYLRSVRQTKEEIENPPDNSEFNNALSEVFGGFW